jgi:starch synthase
LEHKRSVLFVNSGILGHKSVAALLRRAAEANEDIVAEHIDLSDGLSVPDRLIRRALGIRLAPAASNLDLARWRLELNCGLLAARRIAALERSGRRFAAIHFHTQAAAYCSLRRMRATPSIVSIDCTQSLASLEARPGIERSSYRPNIARDGIVFRAARAIVATSEWAAGDLRRVYPESAEKVTVMPYPAPLGAFDPQWIEERHRQARDRARVLFIGGDFVRKGGIALLDAWRAARLWESAELRLVTNYPVPEPLMSPGVTLVRNVAAYSAEWTEEWRRADLFAMPTASEAFGMVYQEAAAAGVPCVGSRINAIPEIVEDGVTGILVAPGAAAELVAALRALIDSSGLRREMGRAARARMERTGAPELYARKLGAVIGAALGAGAGDARAAEEVCSSGL